jgi:hypothetical protein
MAELPICSVFEGTTAADMRWQCDGYNAYFGSAQGLGSHKNSCTLLRDQLMRSVQGTGPIFAAFKNGPPGSSKDMSKQSTLMGGTADGSKKKLLRAGNVTLDRPMWPSMEFELLENDIRACQNRGAHVSTNFIKTRTKQLMKKHYPENMDFKASEGWMLHFRKHNKIKFCHGQNKKQLNIEEKHDDVSFC